MASSTPTAPAESTPAELVTPVTRATIEDPFPDPDGLEGKCVAYEAPVILPTYPTGEPELLPMFLDKRVYQGSSGVVYPQ